EEYGLRVAEVNRRQKEDLAAGKPQLAPDDLHPNYQGQRMIARGVLDAMGYADVKVPERVHNGPLPGVIAEWKIRAAGTDEPPLTEESAAKVKTDGGWATLKLPEKEPIEMKSPADELWLDDYRMMGTAVSLKGKAGDAR